MIVLREPLGTLGWGLEAKIVEDSMVKGEHPLIAFYYVHEQQSEAVQNNEIFYPLAYTEPTREHKNLSWHLNDIERLKELKIVEQNADNVFTTEELKKVFQRLYKHFTKVVPKQEFKFFPSSVSFLSFLNNFEYDKKLSVIVRSDDEEYYRILNIFEKVRFNSYEFESFVDGVYEYSKLPDIYLEEMI